MIRRLIVAGMTACVLLLSLACCCPNVGPQPTEPKPISRTEFSKLIVGKTPNEVIAAVGKPDTTQSSSDGGNAYWYYNGRTFDPVNGKIDSDAQVIIIRGIVDHVNY